MSKPNYFETCTAHHSQNTHAQLFCKCQVWHTFWEGILLNKCGEEVAQRLLELRDATSGSGLEHIQSHWRGQQDPELAAMRQSAREHLEGVDVYWPDLTGCRDGILDSKTKFGKMYIIPYPFHCVLGECHVFSLICSFRCLYL
jgi:hypothetical protein